MSSDKEKNGFSGLLLAGLAAMGAMSAKACSHGVGGIESALRSASHSFPAGIEHGGASLGDDSLRALGAKVPLASERRVLPPSTFNGALYDPANPYAIAGSSGDDQGKSLASALDTKLPADESKADDSILEDAKEFAVEQGADAALDLAKDALAPDEDKDK